MSNTKLELRFAVALAVVGSLTNAMLTSSPTEAAEPPVISRVTLPAAQPPSPRGDIATDTSEPLSTTPAPAASRSTAAPSTTTRPSTARPCVLLRNENVLFGEARQFGEFVLIQTGEGGEIKLKRQEVLCWASSLRALYQYRVDHRQRGDLADLIADANWCIRYDLRDLAAREILKIKELSPNSAVSKRMEEQLLREAAAERKSVRTTALAANNLANETLRAPVRNVGFEESDAPETNVDPNVLRRFASHVQPMLLNRCGNCHSTQNHDPSGWTLDLPGAGSRASARMTRENLASTLEQVDEQNPKQSPLLVMATIAHGGSATPLEARNAKAIAFLQNWIWVAANSIASSSDEVTDPVTRNAVGDARISVPSSPTPSSDETAGAFASDDQNGSNQGPARLPVVANPFDPDLFNRRFHPDSSAND